MPRVSEEEYKVDLKLDRPVFGHISLIKPRHGESSEDRMEAQSQPGVNVKIQFEFKLNWMRI